MAAIGPILFVLGIIVAGLAYPHYSHVDQMISELGGADATHPAIQNWNFVIFGATVIGLAAALMRDAGRVFAGAVLLGLLGLLGTTTEGVVSCDSGCLGKTTEGAAHLGAGLVGFVSGVVALFVLARRWRNDPRWADHAVFTTWCAPAALAGLLLFMASGAANATQVDGLAQRLFAAPLLVFVSVTGWRLYRSSAAHAMPADGPSAERTTVAHGSAR